MEIIFFDKKTGNKAELTKKIDRDTREVSAGQEFLIDKDGIVVELTGASYSNDPVARKRRDVGFKINTNTHCPLCYYEDGHALWCRGINPNCKNS